MPCCWTISKPNFARKDAGTSFQPGYVTIATPFAPAAASSARSINALARSRPCASCTTQRHLMTCRPSPSSGRGAKAIGITSTRPTALPSRNAPKTVRPCVAACRLTLALSSTASPSQGASAPEWCAQMEFILPIMSGVSFCMSPVIMLDIYQYCLAANARGLGAELARLPRTPLFCHHPGFSTSRPLMYLCRTLERSVWYGNPS